MDKGRNIQGMEGQQMTQKEQILKALKAGRVLTQLVALQEFGCFRLASRINELRDEGHDIKTDVYKYTTGGGIKKQIARYRLLQAPKQGELL